MLEEPLGGGAISPLLHQNIQDDSIRAVSHPTWPITLSLSGSHKVQGQPSRPAALRQIMRRTLTFDHNGRHPQLAPDVLKAPSPEMIARISERVQ